MSHLFDYFMVEKLIQCQIFYAEKIDLVVNKISELMHDPFSMPRFPCSGHKDE